MLDHPKFLQREEKGLLVHQRERLRRGVQPGGMSVADGELQILARSNADVPIHGKLDHLDLAHLGSRGSDRA